MTAAYFLTPLAEGDLDDTWDYIADRFGFDVADGVLDSLHRAFQLLAENPEIGHARGHRSPALFVLACRAFTHRLSARRAAGANRSRGARRTRLAGTTAGGVSRGGLYFDRSSKLGLTPHCPPGGAQRFRGA